MNKERKYIKKKVKCPHCGKDRMLHPELASKIKRNLANNICRECSRIKRIME